MITRKFILLLFIFNLYADDKIVLHLDWPSQFQFAGYYMAKEKGFYLDSKLDVEVKKFNENCDFKIPCNYILDFNKGNLFINKDELINNPLRADKFNVASTKGWEYTFNNIEETAKIIYEKYNTQNETLDNLIKEGYKLKELWKYNKNSLEDLKNEKIDELKKIHNFLEFKADNKSDINSIILNKSLKDYLTNNNFTLLVEDNNIPFSFKSVNDFKGIEIDFWNLLSNKLSKKFNIEETLNNKIFNIFSNSIKAKFIYSPMITLNDKYIYTDPIVEIPLSITTKEDINFISDLSILREVKIGILKNLEIIHLLKEEYPHIQFIEIDSIDNGFHKLKNNDIFGYIDTIYAISQNINKHKIKNFKINSIINYSLKMFLQTDKENKFFIELLNNTITKLTKDEKKAILNSYQQVFYHESLNFFEIAKFILPLILLLLIFLFFNLKLKSEIIRRKEIEKELLKVANKDSLTNIYNRRKIEEICENEINRARRYNSTFSIIFLDLNDFKIINDKFGHHIGDEVLIKITESINNNIRETDSFGRWGGDEFLIILPQTNLLQAKNITLELEQKLTTIKFDFNTSLKISSSFGSSQFQKDDSMDSLIKRADDSMYLFKANHKKEKELL